jgi:hypothetical protein
MEKAKTIEGVVGAIWNYDKMELTCFIASQYWQKSELSRIRIQLHGVLDPTMIGIEVITLRYAMTEIQKGVSNGQN